MAAGVGGLSATRLAPDPPRFMYVGSFTSEGRGGGEGLSVFARASEAAPWERVQVVSIANPSFVTLDRSARFLYAAHGDGTQATAFRIDPASGRLTMINQQPTNGANGVHVAIDATGRYLALPNYMTGSLVVLPILPDGSLGPISDQVTLTGEPGPHRTEQTISHPHHSPFDRTGRFIVVPDKGFDKVFVFRLDADRGKLVPGDPPFVASRAGAAPRHVDFHPTLPFAYVINELDSTMTTYQFEPERGALKPVQVLSTLPSSYTGDNTCAEVWVAASGRYVYGSNRGHDSIAIFAVDRKTGTLTAIGWQSTEGRTPRYFGLDPTGNYLYAANQDSDTIVVLRVNQQTGLLSPTKQVVKVKTPSTIAFR